MSLMKCSTKKPGSKLLAMIRGARLESDQLPAAPLAIPAAMWFGPGRLWAWLVVAAYGGALEIAQALGGAGREGSWADAFANTLGAGTGVLLIWIIARTRR